MLVSFSPTKTGVQGLQTSKEGSSNRPIINCKDICIYHVASHRPVTLGNIAGKEAAAIIFMEVVITKDLACKPGCGFPCLFDDLDGGSVKVGTNRGLFRLSWEIRRL